jgi:predicted Zn-dependent protease
MRAGNFHAIKACLLILGTISLLVGCATEPITGRKQLILLGPSEELQLGLTAFEQMKREVPISRDPAANALVQKVGKRIAAVADLPGASWEFVVFESKEANAFCLPGGKVGVYTGILPITQDEAGLATVIGHEVAHAAAHHGAERVSQAMLLDTGGKLVGSYLGTKSSQTQAVFNSVYGIGTQIGITLPHSRTQEARADEIGLIYMARAGYDPEAAIGFWKRFAEYNKRMGGNTPWFLRTHPLDDQRIADLEKWLPRAKQEYRPVK